MLEENKQTEQTYIYKSHGIKPSRYLLLQNAIIVITDRKIVKILLFANVNSRMKGSKLKVSTQHSSKLFITGYESKNMAVL